MVRGRTYSSDVSEGAVGQGNGGLGGHLVDVEELQSQAQCRFDEEKNAQMEESIKRMFVGWQKVKGGREDEWTSGWM